MGGGPLCKSRWVSATLGWVQWPRETCWWAKLMFDRCGTHALLVEWSDLTQPNQLINHTAWWTSMYHNVSDYLALAYMKLFIVLFVCNIFFIYSHIDTACVTCTFVSSNFAVTVAQGRGPAEGLQKEVVHIEAEHEDLATLGFSMMVWMFDNLVGWYIFAITCFLWYNLGWLNLWLVEYLFPNW